MIQSTQDILRQLFVVRFSAMKNAVELGVPQSFGLFKIAKQERFVQNIGAPYHGR